RHGRHQAGGITDSPVDTEYLATLGVHAHAYSPIAQRGGSVSGAHAAQRRVLHRELDRRRRSRAGDRKAENPALALRVQARRKTQERRAEATQSETPAAVHVASI